MIYFFCMVYEGIYPNGKPEMVHCTGESRPYVTLDKNGLAVTRHHANMWAYKPGDKVAKFVPDPRRFGNLHGNVVLRPEQIAALDEAIRTQYFFS